MVALGCAGSLVANWPGHFEPDSLWQLAQGRSGVFNTWHPPVMAWLLGIFERVHRGAALFIVFDAALFFGALLSFGLLSPRPRLAVFPVVVLILASPLVLIYQGVVWKDVLFADASVAAFAALAWAAQRWERPRSRVMLLVLSLLLFSLAGLTRQNGVIVPVCGAAALATVAIRGWEKVSFGMRVGRAAPWAVGALGLVAALMAGATLYLLAHGDGRPENHEQVKRLQVYDLAGALHHDPTLALPVLTRRDPPLQHFLRTQAGPNFTAEGADNLASLPGGDRFLVPDGDAIGAQWTQFVSRHPLLWLQVRSDAFLATFLTPAGLQCPTVFVGVDGEDPALLAPAGLTARYTAKDAWDERYATAFVRTPVFSHLAYGALALILLGLTLRDLARGDPRPELVVVAALLLAGLFFAATFFPISYACDYRYCYFLDVAAMAALAHRAASGGSRSAHVRSPLVPHHARRSLP